MQKRDIIIIGGGPAGVVAAVTARKNYPAKRIMLVREKEVSVIPCGIPYIFNRLDSAEKNVMPDKGLEDNRVEIMIGRVSRIKAEEKYMVCRGKKTRYDKLILATGSTTVDLPIKGIDKKGVFKVKKDFNYLKRMRAAARRAKDVVIIGGGFIGVELAEELSAIKGMKINIIERSEYCLGTTFDKEYAKAAQDALKARGIRVHSRRLAREIGGRGRAEYVRLDNKRRVPADLVIVSVGFRPNTDLAEKAGITVERGGVVVDEYLRTNLPDVFAVGDNAETKDFFTRRSVPVMLASTATSEARIAASNLYELKMLRENKGTLASFSTAIGGTFFGVAGYCECSARQEGFEVAVGEAEAPNHHPGSLPDTRPVRVKLIFARKNQILIGAEAMGPLASAEIINVLALAIQKSLTISEIESWQFSTHPLLTPAPTVYPVVVAAQTALAKIGK